MEVFKRLSVPTIKLGGFRDITREAELLHDPVSGADPKVWIELNGQRYLLKLDGGQVYSEHVGSTFYDKMGIRAQRTELVLFHGHACCLIENIIPRGRELRTFKCAHDSNFWSSPNNFDQQGYTFEAVLNTLNNYAKADRRFVQQLESQFLELFILDAILANRDRHGGNWGYLVSKDGSRETCPVFDNGACLFPNFEIGCAELSKQDWYRLVIDSPKSQVQFTAGKKNTFHNLFQKCRDMLDTNWISEEWVARSIEDATAGLDWSHQLFYRTLVMLRYLCIVKGVPFNEAYKVYCP